MVEVGAVAGEPVCWCCGNHFPAAKLVRLGLHPEVGVCAGCARSLHRRATNQYDNEHPSPLGRVRLAVAAIRTWVVRRGWHRRSGIGGFLRWLDRFLP